MALYARYANKAETPVYKAKTGSSVVNRVLLGTYLSVLEESPKRLRVATAGPDGWVDREDVREDMGLKAFFVDVGQGDGVLVEAPGKRLIVDGGPTTSLHRYLKGWQYSFLLDAGQPVDIDAIVVSHFDADHFSGLIPIIKDERFRFGAVYHNGIARFGNSSSRPDGYDTDLGKTADGTLRTSFSTLANARSLVAAGGLQTTFRKFLEACVEAHDQGRLQQMRRLSVRDEYLPGFTANKPLSIRVLGPVPEDGTPYRYKWFDDSSHTRNGHSVVLRLDYGQRRMLLTGDLNAASESHLLASVDNDEFRVDVAKACHHGSSDFTTSFLKAMSPVASIFSSGDNESYAHPRADAMGAAGRHSRGTRPLVFSTELARSVSSGKDVLYGMINMRTDGDRLVFAQMKEASTGSDLWDSYER